MNLSGTLFFKSAAVGGDPEIFLSFLDNMATNPIYSRMKLSDNPPKLFPDNLHNLVLRNVPKNTATFDPKEKQENLFRSGIYVHPRSLKTWVGKVALQQLGLQKSVKNKEDEARNMTKGEGTRIEHAGDRIYRMLGVPAPRSHLYDTKTGLPVAINYEWNDGSSPVRISEHLGDDAYHMYDIARMFNDKSRGYQAFPVIHDPKGFLAHAKKKTRAGAITDAFLAARDVHDKNIMFTPHSDTPWRIDNGNIMNATGYGRFRKPERWTKITVVRMILPDIRKMWQDTYFPDKDMHDGVVYHGINGHELLDQTNSLLQKLRANGGMMSSILKSAPRGEETIRTLDNRAQILQNMLHNYDAKGLEQELNRNLDWLTGRPR